MGILTPEILKGLYSKRVFEDNKVSVKSGNDSESDLKRAADIAETKIGGSSDESKEASFQSIKQLLDIVPVELMDKSSKDPSVQKIFYHMTDPEKSKIVDEYVKHESEELEKIIKRTDKSEGIQKIMKRDQGFITDFNQSAAMILRFEKLYKLYKSETVEIDSDPDLNTLKSLKAIGAVIDLGDGKSGQIISIGGDNSDIDENLVEIKLTVGGTTTMSKDEISKIVSGKDQLSKNVRKRVASEHAKRMVNISSDSRNSINKWYDWASGTFGKFANDLDEESSETEIESKVDSIKDFSDDTNDIVFNMVFNYKDKEVSLDQAVQRAESRTESTGRRGIRAKKAVFRKIKETLVNAALPIVTNGEIQRPGDYYRLFVTLDREKGDWMNTVLVNRIFNGDSDQYNKFKSAIESENPNEDFQTDYLDACHQWVNIFIEDSYMSEFNDKEITEYKETILSIVLEKKKEIKNYYLSKGFNLGNFKSVLINPEIDLPLYKKVSLAVSEKDRKEESSLRNILTGLGSAALSFFGGGVDIDQSVIARGAQFRKADREVFRGINKFVKGVVGAAGGKEAARKYQSGMEDRFKSLKQEQVKEDMVAPIDGGSGSLNGPGTAIQTPMSLAGDMDTMSLAGPMGGDLTRSTRKKGKKKKKSRSKGSTSSSKVLTFQDFIRGRG